jgi:hypothetical protein
MLMIAWNFLGWAIHHPLAGVIIIAMLYASIFVIEVFNGDLGTEAGRQAIDNPVSATVYMWQGGVRLFEELFLVLQHFFAQVQANFTELTGGPHKTWGAAILAYTIGTGLALFTAFLQTFVWWINHGSVIAVLIQASGILIILYIGISKIAGGGLSLGGGGGGGGHGGGHH